MSDLHARALGRGRKKIMYYPGAYTKLLHRNRVRSVY